VAVPEAVAEVAPVIEVPAEGVAEAPAEVVETTEEPVS